MCRITVNRTVRPIRFEDCGGCPECQCTVVSQDEDFIEIRRPPAQKTPRYSSPEPLRDTKSPDEESELGNRSTVCAICNVDTGNFNLNYGANTCLSCRAFFRRAIQKTRNPNFVCKMGGTCTITEETRRACKKCRYDKCLQAGMNPDCVMQGDQIQQRFFKYIQRKKDTDKKAATMAKLTPERKKDMKEIKPLKNRYHLV